jgi:hypothetical protein
MEDKRATYETGKERRNARKDINRRKEKRAQRHKGGNKENGKGNSRDRVFHNAPNCSSRVISCYIPYAVAKEPSNEAGTSCKALDCSSISSMCLFVNSSGLKS